MTFILNEPLPVRLAGDIFDMVNHEVLLLVTVHCLLEVTWTVLKAAPDKGVHEDIDRLSIATLAGVILSSP